MQERLQRDEEASDEGHHSGLQERRRASLTAFLKQHDLQVETGAADEAAQLLEAIPEKR